MPVFHDDDEEDGYPTSKMSAIEHAVYNREASAKPVPTKSYIDIELDRERAKREAGSGGTRSARTPVKVMPVKARARETEETKTDFVKEEWDSDDEYSELSESKAMETPKVLKAGVTTDLDYVDDEWDSDDSGDADIHTSPLKPPGVPTPRDWGSSESAETKRDEDGTSAIPASKKGIGAGVTTDDNWLDEEWDSD